MSTMDLPFEEAPPGQVIDVAARIAGGLVVLAVSVPLADGTSAPGLLFRFASPEGDFYAPMLLATEGDHLLKVATMIKAASEAAAKAVKAS